MSYYNDYCKAHCWWCAGNDSFMLMRIETNDGIYHTDDTHDRMVRCGALSLIDWAEDQAKHEDEILYQIDAKIGEILGGSLFRPDDTLMSHRLRIAIYTILLLDNFKEMAASVGLPVKRPKEGWRK